MNAPPRSPEAKRPSLLLMEDDATLAASLALALYHRGFLVTTAHNGKEALRAITEEHPDFAVLDLKVPGSSALELLPRLCGGGRSTRAVVLTGYASIVTAVAAVKLGALDYLPKPADVDEIVAALKGDAGSKPDSLPARPLSPHELEWEHLQRVLAGCEGNVTAAARALGLHRRSLQRKLRRRPPPSPASPARKSRADE
jgi:two-component system, response regulator RegA